MSCGWIQCLTSDIYNDSVGVDVKADRRSNHRRKLSESSSSGVVGFCGSICSRGMDRGHLFDRPDYGSYNYIYSDLCGLRGARGSGSTAYH